MPPVLLGLIVIVAVVGRVASTGGPAAIVAAAAASTAVSAAPSPPAASPPAATPALRADWPAAFGLPPPARTLPKHEYGTDGLMGRLAFRDLYDGSVDWSTIYDERATWRIDRLDGLGNYRTDPYQR